MSTTRDTREETFLTQMGAKYIYSNEVKLDDFAKGWDLDNRGRPTPRDEGAIINYGDLIERGSPAPAPILRRTKNGYIVLDGVQRICALKLLGITTFSAYIVDTDSDDFAQAIRALANPRLQGHGVSMGWAKKQAIQTLVIEGNFKYEDVAHMGGWKLADIERLYRIMETDFAIRCAGGPQLNDGIVDTISKVARPEDFKAAAKPIAAFCNTLKQGKFTNGDSQPFIKRFFGVNRKRGKLHDQFQKRFDEFRALPEVQTRLSGRIPSKRRGEIKVIAALKAALTNIQQVEQAKDLMFHMEEAYGLLRQMRTHLEAIQAYSTKAKTAPARSKP